MRRCTLSNRASPIPHDLRLDLFHLVRSKSQVDVRYLHGQQFFPAVAQVAAFCFVYIQKAQGGRIEHFDCIAGIVDQGSKQLEFYFLLLVLCDIKDHAIDIKWRAVRAVNRHAMFCHPAYATVLVLQPVLHREGAFFCNRAHDFSLHAGTVLVQDQRLDRAYLAGGQFIRCVACHLNGHIVIKLHPPVFAENTR